MYLRVFCMSNFRNFCQNIFNKQKSEERKKSAFTMAEAITILVLLGAIAAITIPTLIHNHTKVIKRTQLKNALATYKTAVKSMVAENKFTSTEALDNWAVGPNGDCAPAKAYFQVAQTDAQNPCIFKTPDGTWWYLDSGSAHHRVTIKDTWGINRTETYTGFYSDGRKKVAMSRAIVSFELTTDQDEIERVHTSYPHLRLSKVI